MNKHFMEMLHLGKKENYRYNNKGGFSLLIGVTIIGSIGLILALVLSGLSQSASNMNQAMGSTHNAQGYADACTETALQEIRDTTTYTGTDTIIFSEGSCSYTVSNGGGEVKTIESTGVSRDSTRRVYAETSSLSPQIIISSWQEVADF